MGLMVWNSPTLPMSSDTKYADTSFRKEVDSSLKILDSSIADLRL